MMAGYTNQYEYDGLGNRIKRTVNGTNYIDVLDRGAALPNVLVELNESGEPIRYFVWGLTLIAQVETNGAVYYAHPDELGSTLALTDTNGAIVAEYTYSPYGEILDHTGAVDTPFTFVGGYGVWHDGSGLYQMKARQYSAELRRFTTADPIGLAGGANLHAYCANNPINLVDPYGWCPDGAAGNAVSIAVPDVFPYDSLQRMINLASQQQFRNSFYVSNKRLPVCYNFTAAVYSQTWFPTAPYWQNNPAFQQVAYPDLSNLPRGSLVVYSLPTPNPMNILPNPIFGQPLHSSIATGNGGLTLSVNNDPALGRGDVGWSAQAKTQYYNNPEYWYVPIQIAVFNPVGVPVAWQR